MIGPINIGQFAWGAAGVLALVLLVCCFGIYMGNLFAKIAKQGDEMRRLDRELGWDQ